VREPPPPGRIQPGMTHSKLLPTLFLILAGCASAATFATFGVDGFYQAPDVPVRSGDQDSAWLDAQIGNVARSVAKAPVVFVGRVVAVGPSPGVYSGVVVTRQSVIYDIEEVWKGRAPAPRVVVSHVLAEEPTLDPAEPRLNPAVWRVGARLVIASDFVTEKGAEFPRGEAAFHPVLAGGPAAARVRALIE
jgi:hypothetical protein